MGTEPEKITEDKETYKLGERGNAVKSLLETTNKWKLFK
jgi:hypothetical protein